VSAGTACSFSWWVGCCGRPVGAFGVAAVAALLAVLVAAVGALGAASDRPRPGGGVGGVALGVEFDHDVGAEGGVVLGAADPLGQLSTRPGPDGELAVVAGHKQRVQARGGRPAAALAGGLDGALPDGFGVAGRHAQPVAVKALRSDGRLVPNWATAALTLPSRSASGCCMSC
jgi:hypothetical protein